MQSCRVAEFHSHSYMAQRAVNIVPYSCVWKYMAQSLSFTNSYRYVSLVWSLELCTLQAHQLHRCRVASFTPTAIWHKGQLTLCHIAVYGKSFTNSYRYVSLVWILELCNLCNSAGTSVAQLQSCKFHTNSYMAQRAVEFDCGNDHASWMALTKPLSVTYVCTRMKWDSPWFKVCSTSSTHTH